MNNLVLGLAPSTELQDFLLLDGSTLTQEDNPLHEKDQSSCLLSQQLDSSISYQNQGPSNYYSASPQNLCIWHPGSSQGPITHMEPACFSNSNGFLTPQLTWRCLLLELSCLWDSWFKTREMSTDCLIPGKLIVFVLLGQSDLVIFHPLLESAD